MRPRLSRRDAEAFASAVDGRARGRTEPVSPDRLRELVDVADFIRSSPAPAARRDFVADLRTELMAAAREELSPIAATAPQHRLTGPPRLRRRLTAAASAFVVVGGTLGLVAASAQAMPGDMLYPVKRATEKFELMLRDGAAEGRALLDHAQTRLAEVESLTADPGRDAEDLIAQTLADFTAEASAGGALLLDAYHDDRSAAEIGHLRAFTADSAQRLRDLSGSLPSSAATAYEDATQAVGGLDASAYQACPTCAGGDPALTVATDLLADVAYVLDSEQPSSRPDRSDSKGEDRTGQGRSGVGVPVPTNGPTDPPADTADDPSDGDGPDGDDPASDPTDEVEDLPGDVDESPGDGPIEDVSGPVQDLVKPLTDTVDGLLGDVLGTK